MKISEDTWKMFQQYFGYTDKEMKLFRNNPRNRDVLSKSPALMNKLSLPRLWSRTGATASTRLATSSILTEQATCLQSSTPKGSVYMH